MYYVYIAKSGNFVFVSCQARGSGLAIPLATLFRILSIPLDLHGLSIAFPCFLRRTRYPAQSLALIPRHRDSATLRPILPRVPVFLPFLQDVPLTTL
jgi:hypothetical protein